MSVIRFTTDQNQATYPEGAHTVLDSWDNKVVVWEEYVGKVISTYERNGYHDSDFYAVVWDDAAQQPKSIVFASTRGWSYPAYGSSEDATPEVLAAYQAWDKKRNEEIRRDGRRRQAKALAKFRKECQQAVPGRGYRLTALRKVYTTDNLDRVLHLFSPRIRNAFKIKLREQVVAWANDPAPKYWSPLSLKQLAYI